MLIKAAFVLALAGGVAGLALADGGDAKAPQRGREEAHGTRVEKAAPTLKPGNSIVVHRDVRAADPVDGRVEVGGVRVSAPSGVVIEDKDGVKHEMPVPAAAKGSDGAIAIPDNTMGPGEPMWSISDRLSAERRINEAEAEAAKSAAERPYRIYESGYVAPVYGGWGWSGGWIGRGWAASGLRGPVTTTVRRSDELGSTAQRAFSEAAYPRNGGAIEGHDQAVREFNRAATPPVVKTQEAVDEAHRNAHKEHPKR